MPYELFKNKATKFASPQLTIRGGRISLNADAGDIWDKAATQFAHLLWDASKFKLAIRPAKKQDQNAFRLSTPKGKRGKTMSARSFLKYIRWSSDEAVVVEAHWNEAEGLMETTLPKDHIASDGNV